MPFESQEWRNNRHVIPNRFSMTGSGIHDREKVTFFWARRTPCIVKGGTLTFGVKQVVARVRGTLKPCTDSVEYVHVANVRIPFVDAETAEA
jgi:hypothetical protein